MNTIGLDACKYGWCGIGQINKKMFWGCFVDLDELVRKHPMLDRIFIDIPIGLSSANFKRTVDAKARKFLSKRKSSIFSPPCREALYVETYKQALSINKEIENKGISIQAFNIGPKIKEVDEWLNTKPKALQVYEAHPELCFKALNQNQDLEFSKHDKAGIEMRKRIIFNHQKNLKNIYNNFLKAYKRKDLKADDILDAMALHLINSKGAELNIISDENSKDDTGKKLRIVIGNI